MTPFQFGPTPIKTHISGKTASDPFPPKMRMAHPEIDTLTSLFVGCYIYIYRYAGATVATTARPGLVQRIWIAQRAAMEADAGAAAEARLLDLVRAWVNLFVGVLSCGFSLGVLQTPASEKL